MGINQEFGHDKDYLQYDQNYSPNMYMQGHLKMLFYNRFSTTIAVNQEEDKSWQEGWSTKTERVIGLEEEVIQEG